MLEQVDAPKEGWDSVRSPQWNSSLLEGLQPAAGTHAGAVWEELQPVGRTHVGETLWRTVSRDREPTPEQGKSVSSPPPEEEGAAETRGGELTTTPISCPLRHCGAEGREIVSKAEPGN